MPSALTPRLPEDPGVLPCLDNAAEVCFLLLGGSQCYVGIPSSNINHPFPPKALLNESSHSLKDGAFPVLRVLAKCGYSNAKEGKVCPWNCTGRISRTP